jgi:hypothetical protein
MRDGVIEIPMPAMLAHGRRAADMQTFVPGKASV